MLQDFPELSRLPPQALDVLRYLGKNQITSADLDTIQTGTGLTDRSTNKAIKRLVTRNFMTMDVDRVYHIAPKGYQAISDLAQIDAHGPQETTAPDNTIDFDLCAVIASQLPAGQATRWMVGLNPSSDENLAHPADVYLRISASDGQVSPATATLSLSPENSTTSTEFSIIPSTGQNQVRVRIEALQLFEFDEPGDAGGMYFDIQIGNDPGTVRAIHTDISLL